MSDKDNFTEFMEAVVHRAEEKCWERNGTHLESAFSVPTSVYDRVIENLRAGWSSYMIAAASALVVSPLVSLGLLAIMKGKIPKEYHRLPDAIKEIGVAYKKQFMSHINETSYIDNLIDKASDSLLEKAASKG